MQLPNQQPDSLSTLAKHVRSLVKHILQEVEPAGDSIALDNASDILSDQTGSRIFLIKRGQVQCHQEGKVIFVAEAGDLIGLFRARQLTEGHYQGEGNVELIPYDLNTIEETAAQSPQSLHRWTEYLMSLACLFNQALAFEIPKRFKPATGFLQFDSGDVIISQGEQAECVYTLLEGTADVTHNDVKVGEIKAEEIFGAMALFTKQPRNATVTATSSCSVLAVRKDEFLDLVSHQPEVCMGLIEEMADKINQLNTQVLSLQKSS